MTWDMINAAFNLAGAGAITMSTMRVLRDKDVRGVNYLMIIFFMSWSLWNLAFYAALMQWVSVACGCAMVLAEAVYLGLLMHYRPRPRPMIKWYDVETGRIKEGAALCRQPLTSSEQHDLHFLDD